MRITQNAAASAGQVLATTVIMFVLYRVILDTLGADRLGIWSIVLATASASRIAELGLSASVTRFVAMYRARKDDEAAGHAVQTAVVSIAIILVCALPGAYVFLVVLFDRLFAGEALNDACALLPYALISLIFTAIAAVMQSGLDGCQRYDWRAFLIVAGQMLFLIAALWLTPKYGLIGLAWAQIGQGLMLAVIGWILLRRILPGLPCIPRQWRRRSFNEMLGYGLQFQLGSIAMMLFEPLTKALLGKFGGLPAAGYYEMASRYVRNARLLIVSANQVLVPAVAELNERDSQALKDLYRANLRMLFLFVMPLHALVVAWAPILSEIWIGRYESSFVLFSSALALAWGLNVFASPAYFSNLGTGRVFWNTAAHVWMGIANAVLGFILGPSFGAAGIIYGMGVALVSGSALVVVSFHWERKIAWGVLLPREALEVACSSITLVLAEYYIFHTLVSQSEAIRFLICLLLPFPILGLVLWRHPLRRPVQTRIHKLLG